MTPSSMPAASSGQRNKKCKDAQKFLNHSNDLEVPCQMNNIRRLIFSMDGRQCSHLDSQGPSLLNGLTATPAATWPHLSDSQEHTLQLMEKAPACFGAYICKKPHSLHRIAPSHLQLQEVSASGLAHCQPACHSCRHVSLLPSARLPFLAQQFCRQSKTSSWRRLYEDHAAQAPASSHHISRHAADMQENKHRQVHF